MINFRFHLISLAAVFLALAAGITIGAGVVDRATVDFLQRRLQLVENNRTQTNAKNDLLDEDLARWGRFSQEAGNRMVEGRLQDVPVFIVAARGVDRDVVDGFRSMLVGAGAVSEGAVWFTDKWNLEGDDARTLAGLLGAPTTTRPDDLRIAAMARVTSVWSGGDSDSILAALTEAGFVDVETPAGAAVDPRGIPRSGSLFVVVSGDDAQVASPVLAQPLVERSVQAGLRTLAAQPSRTLTASEIKKRQVPEQFAVALRENGDIAPRISTVDNLQDFRGRVAAVLALEQLQAGQTGHYGFAKGAQRVLPEDSQ